jgi:hypothetical protein
LFPQVLKRWQRFMVLITMLLTSLLTAIWFYSSRAIQCCAEVRSILTLAESVCADGALCRGVGADCADLLAQFADVQGPYWYSGGPGEPATEHMYLDEYVCHAFPDDTYFTDQIFVGLISAAVAWPVRNILQRLFEKANERDDDVLEAWLVAPGNAWMNVLFGSNLHKLWHFTGKRPVSAFVRWMARYPDESPVAYAVLQHLHHPQGPSDQHMIADLGLPQEFVNIADPADRI